MQSDAGSDDLSLCRSPAELWRRPLETPIVAVKHRRFRSRIRRKKMPFFAAICYQRSAETARWGKDHASGDRAHDRKVFQAHWRRPILTDTHADMGACELQVAMVPAARI
jgi:hypothetical protein